MKLSTFIKLVLIVQLIGTPQFGVAAPKCSELFDQADVYAVDFVPYIRTKLGGTEKKWQELIERLLVRHPEKADQITEIFRDTQARSWLSRKVNTATHFRMESIARTIEHVFRVEKTKNSLLNEKNWNDISLVERRALLLSTFKKWWWEVDSHYVMGLSRWTDASYVLGRSLSEPVSQGRLLTRLHELLGTVSQTSFLSGLVSNFRAEIRILKNLKGQPEAREVLQETLTYRLNFLKKARAQYKLTGLRANLLDVQVLRTGVLLRMVEANRSLSKAEKNEVADSLGLPRSLIAEMRWGQFGMSLIPNLHMNSRMFLETMIEIAITTAVAYVIGQYFFEDLGNEVPYRGNFNDVFGVEPLGD